MTNPGLYIHIPFCRKKCHYCNFYSVLGRERLLPEFVAAVLREAEEFSGLKISTLYLGGGTPGLVPPNQLRTLMAGLRTIFDCSNLEESSVEVNPDTAGLPWLEAVRELGFQRLSVGVQSLSDKALAAVGRLHTAEQAQEVLKRAWAAGFKRISVDLMVGLPHQTRHTLKRSLHRLLSENFQHLSLYCLSLEKGTSLGENPPPNLPGDDDQADLFEFAATLLEQEGFIHYEILNFARPGHQCLHNVNYWRGGEYLGLGPDAASHLDGERWRNFPDLDRYLEISGEHRIDRERLPGPAKAAEEAMLRLRLLEEGLDLRDLERRFGTGSVQDLAGRLHTLTETGDLLVHGTIYRLPPEKTMVSNPILASVLME